MKPQSRYDDNPCRPRHFRPAPCAPVALEQPAQQTLEVGRTRLLLTAGLFIVAFLVIALRLVDVTLIMPAGDKQFAHNHTAAKVAASRADIIDRNSALLATTLAAPSLYANPKQILDARGTAQKLAEILPDLSQSEVYQKLTSDRSFVWLKRQLTPRQQFEVNRIGDPGLQFEREERRVYPDGNLVSHVVGYVGIDNRGLAGIERGLDETLRTSGQPVQLSIDLRVQAILREELSRAVADFTAKGGAGIIMDVRTGEVIALVSLPDFDPNDPGAATPEELFNRVTLGAYEMGSTFKTFTIAMALEDHTATLASYYDASHPIHVGRFTIHDYENLHRALSVPEIYEYSSNIGAARIAIDAGTDRMRDFLGRLGLLRAPSFEIPEIAAPLVPSPWHDINTMTIAFGHGLSVSPLQLAIAASAVVNGGILHPATIIKRRQGAEVPGHRVLSLHTSQEMRRLMRLVVEHGTGEFAAAPGYLVGGKTGTAEKVAGHHYARKELRSSFLGVFPINDPRYLVLAIVDEPHGNKASHGFATGGWTAAPAVGRTIQRIAPLLGVEPVDENTPEIRNALSIEGVQVKKLASN